MQLTARHRAFNGRARRSQIAVEIALRQRLESRLIVHILAASRQRKHDEQPQRRSSLQGPHI
jgi:hypothetical protein